MKIEGWTFIDITNLLQELFFCLVKHFSTQIIICISDLTGSRRDMIFSLRMNFQLKVLKHVESSCHANLSFTILSGLLTNASPSKDRWHIDSLTYYFAMIFVPHARINFWSLPQTSILIKGFLLSIRSKREKQQSKGNNHFIWRNVMLFSLSLSLSFCVHVCVTHT